MAFFRASDITGYTPEVRRSVRESSLIAARGMADAFRKAGLQGEELGLIIALTIGDKELLGIYRDALRTYGMWSYRSAPLIER